MSWLIRSEGNGLMKVIGTTMFMLIFSVLLILALSSTTSAHGYIDEAPSRAYLCKQGLNDNCGRVVHEPQSLEALKGFPAAGPADGKIASANGQFPELDEQSDTRWTKVDMNSGINTFHWTLTAAHATTSWKYYITKPDWDPNQPLTRDSFDLTPFCDINDGGARPGFSVTHNCDVPERSGYHVILGVWEVFDTANAFYNVIDVNFSGSTTPDPGNTDDEEAPSVPTNIIIGEVTASSVALSWNPSTDNVGVTGYVVTVNNDVKVVSTPSIVLTGLLADTDYTVSIQAKDAANNISAAATVQVKTAEKAACDYPKWDADAIYVGGEHVEHDGVIYKANWWTRGDNPELRSGQYDVWSFIGACQ